MSLSLWNETVKTVMQVNGAFNESPIAGNACERCRYGRNSGVY